MSADFIDGNDAKSWRETDLPVGVMSRLGRPAATLINRTLTVRASAARNVYAPSVQRSSEVGTP